MIFFSRILDRAAEAGLVGSEGCTEAARASTRAANPRTGGRMGKSFGYRQPYRDA